MKIEEIDISEIKPYGKNPRRNDQAVEIVMKSIKEFGFKNPVIIDKNNEIITGHTRIKAAEKLGLKKIPIIRAKDLNPEQVKAFRIMDNKSSEYAEWDFKLLKTEFEELDSLEYDLELTGFDSMEIADIWDEKKPKEDNFEIPKEAKYKIEPGEIWELGNHRLMCGDATKKEHVEALMEENKADMVLTDPPYGVDYDGIKNDNQEGLNELLTISFKFMERLMEEGSPIYCFHSDRNADIFHKCFRKYFHFSSMIIWNKNSLTLSQTDYQSKHEPCMYGWKEGEKHKFYGDRKQTSVWDSERERVDGHSTPKPLKIISNAINNSSQNGNIILDLFGGSGSTLIACEQLNRKCFMMELDPFYCSVIIERWEKLTGKKGVKLNKLN